MKICFTDDEKKRILEWMETVNNNCIMCGRKSGYSIRDQLVTSVPVEEYENGLGRVYLNFDDLGYNFPFVEAHCNYCGFIMNFKFQVMGFFNKDGTISIKEFNDIIKRFKKISFDSLNK